MNRRKQKLIWLPKTHAKLHTVENRSARLASLLAGTSPPNLLWRNFRLFSSSFEIIDTGDTNLKLCWNTGIDTYFSALAFSFFGEVTRGIGDFESDSTDTPKRFARAILLSSSDDKLNLHDQYTDSRKHDHTFWLSLVTFVWGRPAWRKKGKN